MGGVKRQYHLFFREQKMGGEDTRQKLLSKMASRCERVESNFFDVSDLATEESTPKYWKITDAFTNRNWLWVIKSIVLVLK